MKRKKNYFSKIFLTLAVIVIGFIFVKDYLQSQSVQQPHDQKASVIFVPGLGLTANDYAKIIDSLRQQGYTVQSYEPTYTNTENYQDMVSVWTKGVGELVGDKKTIVMGHSVGGGYCHTFLCNR